MKSVTLLPLFAIPPQRFVVSLAKRYRGTRPQLFLDSTSALVTNPSCTGVLQKFIVNYDFLESHEGTLLIIPDRGFAHVSLLHTLS
jgi:hypothetical protein